MLLQTEEKSKDAREHPKMFWWDQDQSHQFAFGTNTQYFVSACVQMHLTHIV